MIGLTENARRRIASLALFAVWFAFVVYAAFRHALWRDEVRAISIALDAPNLLAMLKGLPSEGHPALWYLLLRGAYTLVPTLQVLQVIAFVVAAVSALILLFYSPFNWEVKAVFLAGNIFLFEYSVMARNYGISMLIMFLLAACYKQHKQRGVLLGTLLFLLANCNAPSIFLTSGFLILWLVDVATGDRAIRLPALRVLMWNSAIAIIGIAASILTILPPTHASASIHLSGNPSAPVLQTATPPRPKAEVLAEGLFLPGAKFDHLMLKAQGSPSLSPEPNSPIFNVLVSVILFGSTLGLIRYPGAFLAALATLTGLSLFFTLFYPGSYRHEALWLCFLIACYWITTSQGDPGAPPILAPWQTLLRPVSTLGWGLFVLLMVVQVPIGIGSLSAAIGDGPPLSCSRDFGAFIRANPEFQDAILMAEPDFMLEPLRYYVSNPKFFVRAQRFGNIVLPEASRSQLTLDDILNSARSLHASTNKPVLILMAHALDPFATGRVYREPRDWEFLIIPEQVRAFLSATEVVERFPAAILDEHFDVYLLK